MLAFDCTYLQPRLSQLKLWDRRGLIGGQWNPAQPDDCFRNLDESVDISSIAKATQVLEFLCWDPSSRSKKCLSPCSMPIKHNFDNTEGSSCGSWYMLDTVGQLLEAAGSQCIRAVVFDAATTHNFVRRAFHGDVLELDGRSLASTPFFGKLSYRNLPPHPLPRLPIRMALASDGEVVWGLPGVCNSVILSSVGLCSHICYFHLFSLWGPPFCNIVTTMNPLFFRMSVRNIECLGPSNL